MMKEKSVQERWNQLVRRVQASPTYGLEGLLLSINEEICSAMEEQRVSRTDLAERLGKSKAWVTKFLGGNRNLTLKTLVHVANALDLDVNVGLQRRQVGFQESAMTEPAPPVVEKSALRVPFAEEERPEMEEAVTTPGGTKNYALAA